MKHVAASDYYYACVDKGERSWEQLTHNQRVDWVMLWRKSEGIADEPEDGAGFKVSNHVRIGQDPLIAVESEHEPFAGGGVREAVGDRARFELLLPLGVPYSEQLLTRCAVHMAQGARKYASRNWEDFSDEDALERCRSSALRHIHQWMTGVDDGEDHAAAVVFNLMAAEHVKAKLEGRY